MKTHPDDVGRWTRGKSLERSLPPGGQFPTWPLRCQSLQSRMWTGENWQRPPPTPLQQAVCGCPLASELTHLIGRDFRTGLSLGRWDEGSRLECLSCSVLGVVGGGGRFAHSHCPGTAGEGDQGSTSLPAWGLWGSGFQAVCRGTSLGSSLTLGVGTGYSFTLLPEPSPLQLPILSKQFVPWLVSGSQFIQALRFVLLRILKCIKKTAKSFVITFPFLK